MANLLAKFKGHDIYSPVIKKILDDGRLLRHQNGQWFAECIVFGCLNETCVSSYHGRRHQKCWRCSSYSLIAGRHTRSKVIINHAHLIVAWRKRKSDGSGSWAPMVKCLESDCENLAVFSQKKINDYGGVRCVSCYYKSKKLPPFQANFNRLQDSAKKRGIQVTLSYDEFAAYCLSHPNCTYCGEILPRLPNKDITCRSAAMAHFLDRIDSNKGYDLSNITSCCGPCNITKCRWISFDEMCLLGAIRKGDQERAKRIIEEKFSSFLVHQSFVANTVKWRKKHT